MDFYCPPPRLPTHPHYLPWPHGKRAAALTKACLSIPISLHRWHNVNLWISFRSRVSSWNANSPSGTTRMEGEQYHSERAWVFCQVLGVIWVSKTKLMPEGYWQKYRLSPLNICSPISLFWASWAIGYPSFLTWPKSLGHYIDCLKRNFFGVGKPSVLRKPLQQNGQSNKMQALDMIMPDMSYELDIASAMKGFG